MGTAAASGDSRKAAFPIAWPLPCSILVTSASTFSTGSFGRSVATRLRWIDRRVCVVRALSFRICAASGAGAEAVAEVVPLAAADVVALEEVCADDASVDVPESDLHAVTTPTNRAAPSATAAGLRWWDSTAV